ncbi:MAG: class I SAM-dependent methyltransferase [Betaproteobacteria bacterium]
MSAKQPAKACPQCKGEAPVSFRTTDLNRGISDETFDYYACNRCGLIFLDPMPADLGRYYPNEYYVLPESLAVVERYAKHEQYKIDLVVKHLRRGRLIEIGPATGGFCFLAKQAGFDVQAIEMDARCSAFLRDVIGIAVVNSNEEVVALNRLESADVIALWHVVEHLRDPWTMVDAIAAKLRPGGIAVIATPNTHALQFKVWKARWTHVDAPRHVVLIPPELLIERMQANGMELVELTTSDPGGIGWNWFGWVFSFANLTKIARFKRPLRGVGRIVRALVRPIEDREGRGAAYTAIFRKSA